MFLNLICGSGESGVPKNTASFWGGSGRREGFETCAKTKYIF